MPTSIFKQHLLNYILILVMSTTIVGCATIFKGSTADVRVNSSPSGADIFINKMDKGKTPQTLTLDRDEDHILTFRKEGYEEVRVEVKSRFDGATTILGNLLSWALLGIVVDVATGAAYSLEPADVQANLAELKQSGLIDALPENGSRTVTVIMLTKEEWNKISAQ